MPYQASSRGRGQNLNIGRSRHPGHDSAQSLSWVQPRMCSQNTCRIQGFCEYSLMKEEYGDLLQRNHRSRGVESVRRNGPGVQKQALEDPRAFFKTFFEGYEQRYQREHPNGPIFLYEISEPVIYEFYRMCRLFGWRKPPKGHSPNPEFVKAREGFRDALTLQFNALYGTDEDDLSSWQNLCCVLNLAHIPDELEACRNLVASMHVNIMDLIDMPIIQEPIVHFKSEEHLSIYTRHTGKKFPRDNVYSGDLLRFLLRKIDAYTIQVVDWRESTNWGRVLSDSSLKH